MKHLFMAFIILFSALSSSWAGVGMSSPEKMQHSHSEHHAHHNMQMMASHDCCPSEASKVQQASGTLASDNCSNCLDDCHCSSFGSANSPLITLKPLQPEINSLQQSHIFTFASQFADITLSSLERPPRFN